MTRQIIQIQTVSAFDTPNVLFRQQLFVLCNDGAVFQKILKHNDGAWGEWIEMESVPQPKLEPTAISEEPVFDDAATESPLLVEHQLDACSRCGKTFGPHTTNYLHTCSPPEATDGKI